MEYTKQELEALLTAFKILEKHEVNARQSVGSIEDEVKEIYVNSVMEALIGEK